MKQLKKDYYTLPDAAERSGHPINDFLWLAEKRHINLSVEVDRWPFHWGDERVFPGEIPIENDNQPAIEIENPGKIPFDSIHSGYLNLFWYDIRQLREDRKLSLTEVYAEHKGRKFIGHIQKRSDELRGRQHECDLELSNILISHEDLQRVESHEVGDWDTKKVSAPESAVDARTAQKDETQAMYEQWYRESLELEKQRLGTNKRWVAKQIEKMPIARGRSADTIRKNIGILKRKLGN